VDLPLSEHHVRALRNKLLPVTASTIAAASGFAALAISKIRPIREMGLWTALGLVIGWLVAYTLFPALQRALHAPTRRARTASYERVARVVPSVTYRHRHAIVLGALALCVAGAVAVFGLPGILSAIRVEESALAHIDHTSALYRDIRWYQSHALGTDVVHVWIHLPQGDVLAVDALRAIDQLQTQLEAIPGVTSVTGPTTALRLAGYLGNGREELPPDPAPLMRFLLMVEPELRAFVDPSGRADVQLAMQFGAPLG
jgi:predicted RND superfamily exporter protein